MGIREKLNDNPAITTGATATIVVVAIAFIVWQLMPNNPKISTEDYYTVDDGTSWFKDDIKKIPPYSHDGKDAVRARVFKCPSGSAFVGYLEKYSPEAKKQLEATQAPPPTTGGPPMGPAFNPAMEAMLINGRLVKKPGDKAWISERDPNFQKVVDVKCPDGSSDIELVTPVA